MRRRARMSATATDMKDFILALERQTPAPMSRWTNILPKCVCGTDDPAAVHKLTGMICHRVAQELEFDAENNETFGHHRDAWRARHQAERFAARFRQPCGPEHQVIADRLHAEAHSWPWRRQLIADRICELEDLEHVTEQALVGYAPDSEIRDAVLQMRDLLARATMMWMEHELDYADSLCEQSEHALIELRTIARNLGAV
jgi:hypothetical protein